MAIQPHCCGYVAQLGGEEYGNNGRGGLILTVSHQNVHHMSCFLYGPVKTHQFRGPMMADMARKFCQINHIEVESTAYVTQARTY